MMTMKKALVPVQAAGVPQKPSNVHLWDPSIRKTSSHSVVHSKTTGGQSLQRVGYAGSLYFLCFLHFPENHN